MPSCPTRLAQQLEQWRATRCARIQPSALGAQNETLAPSWMFRGPLPCAVVMNPNVLLLCVVFGAAKTTRFKAFDAEARISRRTLSLTWNSLSSAMSSCTVHGVRRYDILRGVSP